ncbi:MAG: hypothetical protein L3J83_08210 [Proteobacteria bacterium]|nr:hypothetical protein [Pseudomonadota bacterium]
MYNNYVHQYKMNTKSKKPERKLLELATKAVYREAGLVFIIKQELMAGGVRYDAIVQIKGYENTKFAVEVKKRIQQANLGPLINQIQQFKTKGILITEYINPNMADKLRNHNVQFMDTVGNIYINEKPLYIFIKGNKIPQKNTQLTFETTRRGRAFQVSGLKVIFALLTHPKLINTSYREIAKIAGVALGTVGWTINDLKQGKYLVEYNKCRQFKNISDLINKWVDGYLEKLRPKQYLGLFSSDKGNWLQNNGKNITKYNAKLGGETAASILTGNIKPEIITIYLDQYGNTKLLTDNRFRRDPAGNILVFKASWSADNLQEAQSEITTIVHPLIIYADLLATQDPRNIETARIIYDKHLSEITKQY